jgi:nucleoside permease NupC
MLRITSNLLTFIGFVTAVYGYFDNLFKLFTAHETEAAGKIAARILGVLFFPLGCIIGWF